MGAAFYSNSSLRLRGHCCDGDLWDGITAEFWQRCGAPEVTQKTTGPSKFLRVAASAEEGETLFTLLTAGSFPRNPTSSLQVNRQTTDFPATALCAAADNLIAAAGQNCTEVSLFNSNLNRLPPLRTRAKPIVDVAVSSTRSHITVGSVDGQINLYSLNEDSDALPIRLPRLSLPSGLSSTDTVGFAGLHFISSNVLVAGVRGHNEAALIDASRQVVVSKYCNMISCAAGSEPPAASDLVLISPLGKARGHLSESHVLLCDAAGRINIWDVRCSQSAHKGPSCVLDLGATAAAASCAVCATVDASSFKVACAFASAFSSDPTEGVDPRRVQDAGNASSLRWGDLRMSHLVELPVGCATASAAWSSSPPFLHFGSRGGLLAWWLSNSRDLPDSMVSVFAEDGECPYSVRSAPSAMPVVPLAACRIQGDGPLILGYALQRVKSRLPGSCWEYHLCSVGGVHAPVVLPTVSEKKRGSEIRQNRQRANTDPARGYAARAQGANSLRRLVQRTSQPRR